MTTVEERMDSWATLTEEERLKLAHELEEFEPEEATLEELELLSPWDKCRDRHTQREIRDAIRH